MPELFPGVPPRSGEGVTQDQIGVTVQGFDQSLANIASLTTEGLLRRLLDGTYETVSLDGSVDWANPGEIGSETPSAGAFTEIEISTQLLLLPTGTPPSNGAIRVRYEEGDFLSGFFGGFASNFQISHTIPSTAVGLHNTAGAIALQWTPIGNVTHGRVLIGTGTDNGVDRLQVNGSIRLASFLVLPSQSPPTTPTGSVRLFANASNNLAWRNPAGNIVTINASDLTASREVKLQNKAGTIAYLDDIPAGGGSPSQSSNSYYTNLVSLSPNVLVGLEDWSGNVIFNRSNDPVGFLSGNFAQQRPSLLSDTNARSTLFRTGAALLDGLQISSGSIVSCTIACRFRARADARGVLFSYGNTEDFAPSAYDRVVYLNGNTISVYGFDAVAIQAVNLDSSQNVRDSQPHTLVVRFSPLGVDAWLDNVRIINDPRLIKQDYNGFWRIGHGLIFGSRSSFGGFARNINISGFATFSRLLSDSGELQTIHTNA